ncbi:MAG: hypothetical protein MI924_17835 [Chloroflexales bacterium]|nr:hypothetical protein [Chloroflexales bacterium]
MIENIECQELIAERRRLKLKRSIRGLLLMALSSYCFVFLSACLLVSGEVTTADQQASGGNLSAEFVSAEGATTRVFQVAEGPESVQVTVIVAVEQGDLRLDLFEPNGALAFSVESRPDNSITRSGQIQTDDQGRIRYRINAQGARNGSYQLFFRR